MSASNFTIEGNLTRDPELKFTNSGTAVAKLGVAVSERKKNQATGQWENGDTSFFDLQVWGQLGENCAENLAKGQAVIASGRMKQRKYQAQDGTEKTVIDYNVDSIGADLRWAKPKGESRQAFDEAPF